jgi:hypothetical protein
MSLASVLGSAGGRWLLLLLLPPMPVKPLLLLWLLPSLLLLLLPVLLRLLLRLLPSLLLLRLLPPLLLLLLLPPLQLLSSSQSLELLVLHCTSELRMRSSMHMVGELDESSLLVPAGAVSAGGVSLLVPVLSLLLFAGLLRWTLLLLLLLLAGVNSSLGCATASSCCE